MLHVDMNVTFQGNTMLWSWKRALRNAYEIQFDSVLPGGMASATFKVPWSRWSKMPDLMTCETEISWDATVVWWGRVSSADDVVENGVRYIQVTAQGPWADMNETPFNQHYDGIAADLTAWTASQVIQAAVFGNCPDVLPCTSDWDGPASILGDVSFSDTTVQNAVTECLRFGDNTTSPWAFVVLPPVTRFARDVNLRYGSLTLTDTPLYTLTNSGTVYDVAVPKHRPHGGIGGAFLCGALTSANAYVQAGTGNDTVIKASMWVFIPRYVYENWDICLMSFIGPNPYPEIARLYITVTNADTGQLHIYNDHLGATYNSSATITIGQGCWHFVTLEVKVSAGAGYMNAQLDGVYIIGSGIVDTGTTTVWAVNWGIADPIPPASDRILYIDTLTASFDGRTPLMTDFVNADGTTGCKTLLFKRKLQTDSDVPDFWVGQSHGRYNTSESTDKMVNLINMKSGEATTPRVPLKVNDASAEKYGVIAKNESATKLDWAIAEKVAERIMVQRSSPQPRLQSFTLVRPPKGRLGAPVSLATIRAGMTFRVIEQPELGLLYVGQASFKQGTNGASDTVDITPDEPALNLGSLLAAKSNETWT